MRFSFDRGGDHGATRVRKRRTADQFAALPAALRVAISVEDPWTPALGTYWIFTGDRTAAVIFLAAAISCASLALVTNTGRLTRPAEVATLGPLSRYSPGEKASTAAISLPCAAATRKTSAAE